MITIFNGRRLSLGAGSPTEEIYVQVSVALREHLHCFRGPRLAVFLALALHADRDGVSYPSVDTLCRETGYLRKTVSAALTELCDLKIDGYPVLARVSQRDGSARFAVSRFQIFPANVETNVGKIRPTVAKAVVANKEVSALAVGKKRPKAEVLAFSPVGKKGDTVTNSDTENKGVTDAPCNPEPCTAKRYTETETESRVPSNRVPSNGTRTCKGLKNNHVQGQEPFFEGFATDSAAAEPVFFESTNLQESSPTEPEPPPPAQLIPKKPRKPSSDDVTPPAFRDPLEKRFFEYLQVEAYEMTGPEMARIRTEIKRLWVLGKKQIVMLDEFLGCFDALATMRYPSGTLKFTSLNWGLVGKKYRDWRAGRLKDEYNGNGFAPGKDVKKNAGTSSNTRSLTSADII